MMPNVFSEKNIDSVEDPFLQMVTKTDSSEIVRDENNVETVDAMTITEEQDSHHIAKPKNTTFSSFGKSSQKPVNKFYGSQKKQVDYTSNPNNKYVRWKPLPGNIDDENENIKFDFNSVRGKFDTNSNHPNGKTPPKTVNQRDRSPVVSDDSKFATIRPKKFQASRFTQTVPPKLPDFLREKPNNDNRARKFQDFKEKFNTGRIEEVFSSTEEENDGSSQADSSNAEEMRNSTYYVDKRGDKIRYVGSKGKSADKCMANPPLIPPPPPPPMPKIPIFARR